MVLAGIDIGTNTVRLLVGELDGSRFRDLQLDRRITRLGEGLGKSGNLKPAAIRRTMEALHAFKEAMRQYPVNGLTVVGTSAVRSAHNREEFLEQVRGKTGFEIEVITGEEEAQRTYAGVALGLTALSSALLIIDIGGGSTEFISCVHGKVEKVFSSPLGVVSLTERFLVSDPSSPDEIRSLWEYLSVTLHELPFFSGLKPVELVATAGTATTLAAMAQGLESYDRQKVHNYFLPRSEIQGILEGMVCMTLKERKKLPGLDEGREDVIVAGILILLTCMDVFGVDGVRVSDFGLLEGILIHHSKRMAGGLSK